MKPFEIKPAAPQAPAKADLGQLAHDPGSELQQRLWQLLMPVPETGELGALNPAAMGGMAGAQGHARDGRDRDRDATSELTSTAHLLAAAVHQLGLISYGAQDGAQPSATHAPAPAFQLELGHVDAHGGSASLSVAHPQLGDIALEVELQNGVLHVIASAPNEYAAQVLLEGQAVLAARLARQGVSLAALDVVVQQKKNKDSQRARARARRQER